ncbi:ferrooxidoreductase Fet3 [Coniosporium apollinis CBS 100218]|uniref:Ferrooxidoreductase Fet3 n=1 Tax=Coniosporium apollinis (strain CBS 100218) TaxID=1168221 RepID=R7YKH0_CONA1|nr:ferrooxidoreductase Fet3 [Coniosporium apollinis CBS 100218]EON62388.1 ferrooxidoreductase Fet3 [Coniosporium apollinis CBS 100218]
MAISLSNFLIPSILFLATGLFTEAATVTYDFDVSWVHANPDGAFVRPVIGINGQWPIPTITATKGDRVIVNVKNSLGNETTSLHFHGLFQNGTTHMDGPASVTQCGIPPGSSFTYDFMVEQPGTYWYHSHTRGQYPDGLRGPLIIHDPDSPYKDQYDEEIILTFEDWYHDMMNNLLAKFISVSNPTGAEPVPQSALWNSTQNISIPVQPGKTYMFRMVNMAAFSAPYVWFEGHTMRVVEVDGIYTEPAEANMLYMTAAQRYSVLITMNNDTSSNFAFVASMDQDLFDQVPEGLNSNVTGWLVYDNTKELPTPAFVDEFDPFDDYTLVPQDGMSLLDEVDYSITFDMKMDNLGDGANYAFFNDITYVRPKVPTLYTALTTGSSATNPAVYGVNTNSFVLNKNDVVEIILNNDDPGKHPFHLHGHEFQVAFRSDEEAGAYVNNVTMPQVPMRRDTVLVRPNGNIVLRFRANNPGIWLFHCHIEWHVASGLVATMVEAPLDLQQNLKIPEDHYQACRDGNIPIEGNAAGNTVDLLDLRGANVSPDPLPAGFTTKGIVALVFSCLSAFLGVAVIAWYGAAPIGKAQKGSS